MAFSAWILIIGGLKISAISMLQVSPALGIPMGKVYYALPIAGVLIIIYSLMNIFDTLRAIRASSLLVENHHD